MPPVVLRDVPEYVPPLVIQEAAVPQVFVQQQLGAQDWTWQPLTQ